MATVMDTTVRTAGDAVTRADAIFVSPETAAAILGISRSAIYDLLKGPKPELDSVRHGKRRLVTRASLIRWAEARLREAGIMAEGEPPAGSAPQRREPVTALNSGESCYVQPEDRFVVMFAASYDPRDNDSAEFPPLDTAQGAAYWALHLIVGSDAFDTEWHVLDRRTGEHHIFEQKDFDHPKECAKCDRPIFDPHLDDHEDERCTDCAGSEAIV